MTSPVDVRNEFGKIEHHSQNSKHIKQVEKHQNESTNYYQLISKRTLAHSLLLLSGLLLTIYSTKSFYKFLNQLDQQHELQDRPQPNEYSFFDKSKKLDNQPLDSSPQFRRKRRISSHNYQQDHTDPFILEAPQQNVDDPDNFERNIGNCSKISLNLRFDCHPESGASELSCADRRCCWASSEDGEKNVPLNVPACYYPGNWTNYKYVNRSRVGNDFVAFLQEVESSFYGNDVPVVKIEATSLNESILRVKIYDPVNPRYEPPWPVRPDVKPFERTVKNPKYTFEADEFKIGFRIKRAADNSSLFDTIGNGGFIFADQFLQISAILPSHNIYGLGEHRTNLRLKTNWQILTMFNKDQPPTEHANLYGSHPFYLVIEESGKCHGVLFLNSNAMDVILQPAPAVTFRTIGGIFDIYFFMGPTPSDVLKQYSEIVGKPIFPPYWSLGFHLCRLGLRTLNETREVWQRTRNAGIPIDTQWNDFDYMNRRNDFTYDRKKFQDLPAFIDELHSLGMHYIPLIDAGVGGSEINGTYPPYDQGIAQDIFIKDGLTNKPYAAKVWNPVSTVFPDYTHPNAQSYYYDMMRHLHKDIAFDGAWIDMNEPSNFYDGFADGCPRNKFDYPPYLPNVVGRSLSTKTICMDAKHYLGNHYDIHNIYGTGQAIVTNYALTTIRKKRPFVVSRATFLGAGSYAAHWTGDIYSSWHDLRMSVPEILAFSLFQIPMVGADICGFDGNATEALCNRWMQLGAFYPFSRNHNSDDTTEQDPAVMGELVIKSSRKALSIRYKFLPYLYTLFFRAHKFGETVARPLFIEFIEDKATFDVDTQFLWGSSFMVIPVLEEGKTEVTAYVPRGRWYDYHTKMFIHSTGMNVTIKAPLDKIPILIRGGIILPAQAPAMTTTASRRNKFELLVALDENGLAEGELYWDDGESLDSLEKRKYKWFVFTVRNQTLKNFEVEEGLYDDNLVLGKVTVMGVVKPVHHVFLNGVEMNFTRLASKSLLKIGNLMVDMRTNFTLSWR